MRPKHPSFRASRPLLASLIFLFSIIAAPTRASAALAPDEILLIVNKNVPAGVKLAKYYAKLRGVPEKQLLELNLPGTDEIAFQQYETEVVPAVRQFIQSNGLEPKIKCLLTFYGMPLKIANRPADPDAATEKKRLDGEALHLRLRLEPIIADLERTAQKLDPTFNPGMGHGTVDDLARRAEAAGRRITQVVSKSPQSPEFTEAIATLNKSFQELAGKASMVEQMAHASLSAPNQTPDVVDKWTKLLEQVQQARLEFLKLSARRYDAAARDTLRKLVQEDFGQLEYARLILNQSEYLSGTETAAALDSELSMLWWDYYRVTSWTINPLNYQIPPVTNTPRTLMTMRLDAPSIEIVNNVILTSIKVEKEGLKGRFVVDSRGLDPADKDPKIAPYAPFDERLRGLARFLKAKTSLPLVWDDNPDVIRREPDKKIRDVALYCGWYAVGFYVPSFQFKLGAVAYHVASFEMPTLRGPGNGWCKGLLNDGVAVTLGPVNEPYLQAFPAPDEFFPLLLTGKLTLAETYWKTIEWTSWQMCIIGDPLYTPFKQNPAIRIEDLPARMQQAIFSNAAATGPTTCAGSANPFTRPTNPASPATTQAVQIQAGDIFGR